MALNNMVNHTLYGSSVVNGQLVTNFTTSSIYPSPAAAPYMYGNGAKPATLAGFAAGSANPLSTSSGITGNGGGVVMNSSPFDLKNSPVIWAILFLGIGMIGLRTIHWKAEGGGNA